MRPGAGSDDVVHTVVVIEGLDWSAVASELWASSEMDASSRPNGMPQRYYCERYRLSAEEPDSRFAWMVRGRSSIQQATLGDETFPPTERGALAITMRGMLETQRTTSLLIESTIGNLARELGEERRMRKSLEADRERIIMLHETILDRVQDRQLRAEQEARKSQQVQKAFEMFAPLAQIAAVEWLKGKGLSTPPSFSRDSAIGIFLSGLTVEQIEQVMGALNPEQAAFFVKLYQQYRAEQKAKDQQAEAAKDGVPGAPETPPKPKPEAN